MSTANITKEQAVSLANRWKRDKEKNRVRTRGFEAALVRKSAVAVTAGSFAALTRFKVRDDIAGVFPWKLGVFVLSTAIEALSDNLFLTAFAAGVSDGSLATYMDRAIVKGDVIAGEGGGYLEETAGGGEL